MDGCSGLLSSSLSLILCIPFFSSDGRTGAVCRWTQLLHFQVWTYAADGRTDATVGRITWSVDVLWACGGGGGDDQKDQRTMKTLGRDIVGGSLSLSLYLGRRCRFTDSFHPRCCLPLSSASTAAWHVAIEATFIRVAAPVSYILKRFDFATSRFWESAPKHLYDMSGQWVVLRLHCCQVYEGDIFASTLVHFRNFPHSLKRKPNSHDGF